MAQEDDRHSKLLLHQFEKTSLQELNQDFEPGFDLVLKVVAGDA